MNGSVKYSASAHRALSAPAHRAVAACCAWLLTVAALGCSAEDAASTTTTAARYRGQHVHTLLLGTSDNAESVKLIPNADAVLLVASKARRLSRLAVGASELTASRNAVLFENDPTESELTNVDVSADGTWAAVTRTTIAVDGGGKQTACGGQVVLVDVTDTAAFGTILAEVTVGAMPDALDISDDDRIIVVANERDGPDAWGKCEVVGAKASISVLDVAGGPKTAKESTRIEMVDGDTGPREPESVMFGGDNDLVAVTLQDSHEVVMFRVSAILAKASPTSADVQIVRLPNDSLGAGPWPDGVGRFVDGAGDERFVTSGEWNDTFSILDDAGAVVSTTTLLAKDLPAALPRVIDDGSPLFSPDSVASFTRSGRAYLAFSLRHAGAIAVYDVTDPLAVTYADAIAVGRSEAGKADKEGSTIRPEGIAAAKDGRFIVTANEAESSATLIVPSE